MEVPEGSRPAKSGVQSCGDANWMLVPVTVGVKLPLCTSFLCLNSLSILPMNLLWCLFLLHFRYTNISMKNTTRPKLQDKQKWVEENQ